MELIKEETGAQQALIKIKIQPEDYDDKVQEGLKTYKRTATMKGFRKGMVPGSLIKKMYGNQILADELNKLIQTELGKFLEESKIDLLGDPLPLENESNNIDIDTPGEYEFHFELGVAPEFDLNVLEGEPEFEQVEIIIEDSMINDEVERLQKQYGEMTNPEGKPEEGDVLYCSLEELDEEGNVKEGGVSNDTPIALDMLKDEWQKKALDMETGSSVDADITEMIDRSEHDIAHHILGMEAHNLEGVNKIFRVNLKKINRVIPAEINEELLSKIFGDEIKDEEGMRNKISEELSAYFDKDTERKLEADIVDKLLEETKMDFPQDFLKKWLLATNEQNLTEEQINDEYGYFERSLKWSLIIKKISRENEIKVDLEQMRNYVKANVLRQYGIVESEQFPAEAVNNMADEVLKDEEQRKKIYDTLLEEQLFTWIKSKIKTKRKKLSLDDYKKLVNPQ